MNAFKLRVAPIRRDALQFPSPSKSMSWTDSSGSPFTIAVGARMGAYEILSPLGVGGMGEVYRVRDTRLGREVALKLIRVNKAHDQTARDRIEREARMVASLNHPNILALHDIGTANGTMYIVTELVDGESLRGLTPPLRKCLDIAAQIADVPAKAVFDPFAARARCEGWLYNELPTGHDAQAEMPEALCELLLEIPVE